MNYVFVGAGNALTVKLKIWPAVTSETSIRLAAYFGGSPLVWLRMQAVYDLARVETEKGAAIRRSVRVAEKSM